MAKPISPAMKELRSTEAACPGSATENVTEATRSQACNSKINNSAIAASALTSLVNGSLATSWATSGRSCKVCQEDAAKPRSFVLRSCTGCDIRFWRSADFTKRSTGSSPLTTSLNSSFGVPVMAVVAEATSSSLPIVTPGKLIQGTHTRWRHLGYCHSLLHHHGLLGPTFVTELCNHFVQNLFGTVINISSGFCVQEAYSG